MYSIYLNKSRKQTKTTTKHRVFQSPSYSNKRGLNMHLNTRSTKKTHKCVSFLTYKCIEDNEKFEHSLDLASLHQNTFQNAPKLKDGKKRS